jgi:hypothetical protein
MSKAACSFDDISGKAASIHAYIIIHECLCKFFNLLYFEIYFFLIYYFSFFLKQRSFLQLKRLLHATFSFLTKKAKLFSFKMHYPDYFLPAIASTTTTTPPKPATTTPSIQYKSIDNWMWIHILCEFFFETGILMIIGRFLWIKFKMWQRLRAGDNVLPFQNLPSSMSTPANHRQNSNNLNLLPQSLPIQQHQQLSNNLITPPPPPQQPIPLQQLQQQPNNNNNNFLLQSLPIQQHQQQSYIINNLMSPHPLALQQQQEVNVNNKLMPPYPMSHPNEGEIQQQQSSTSFSRVPDKLVKSSQLDHALKKSNTSSSFNEYRQLSNNSEIYEGLD